MPLKLSKFSQVLCKISKFSRDPRASKLTTVYFYYQHFLIATPGEAQQQKMKAVYELPVKRLAFQEACRFVGQFRVSRCRFWMQFCHGNLFDEKAWRASRACVTVCTPPHDHYEYMELTWSQQFPKNRDTSSNICRALHQYWIFQSNL